LECGSLLPLSPAACCGKNAPPSTLSLSSQAKASRLANEKRQQAAALHMHLPTAHDSAKGTRDWPHAPPHRLASAGVYFLTARAAHGCHLLADDAMKDWFQQTFFDIIDQFKWQLEAWAILSNHYHFIAHSPSESESAESLRHLVRKLHSLTTKELNCRENCPGRTRLWQNFRETHLTHQRSYLARLHYVHQNAVHHKLVTVGSDWKWCSARAFKEAVSPAWLKTIASFDYDEIAIKDGDCD